MAKKAQRDKIREKVIHGKRRTRAKRHTRLTGGGTYVPSATAGHAYTVPPTPTARAVE